MKKFLVLSLTATLFFISGYYVAIILNNIPDENLVIYRKKIENGEIQAS